MIISLKVQRFKCRTCGATIVHRVPGMDTVHSMTVRCVEWIGKQSLRDTFVRVAEGHRLRREDRPEHRK